MLIPLASKHLPAHPHLHICASKRERLKEPTQENLDDSQSVIPRKLNSFVEVFSPSFEKRKLTSFLFSNYLVIHITKSIKEYSTVCLVSQYCTRQL